MSIPHFEIIYIRLWIVTTLVGLYLFPCVFSNLYLFCKYIVLYILYLYIVFIFKLLVWKSKLNKPKNNLKANYTTTDFSPFSVSIPVQSVTEWMYNSLCLCIIIDKHWIGKITILKWAQI